ncbi:GGDEF domain-containing protein [Pantoea rodasii]|uniref:diguanylate cyclase n=2 Tax=Pantoea rodasii TaxID=1076549 RepID=A0A2M9WJ64_9GAMM|nr:GGDEF domain-containing protein [Pantoea rodasii]
MVLHALKRSLPWFAFVNISFALMVLLRGLLFEGIDNTIPSERELLPWLDTAMMLIMAAAVLLPISVMKFPPLTPLGRWLPGALLCIMSVVWSAATYGFVAIWHIPLGWPLVCILLLSGLTAFYYTPGYLLCFILPLWLTLPIISERLNDSINPRFVVVWIILTIILTYGRQNLQRWFNEAWARYAENQLLIGRLNQLASQDPLTGIANRRALEQHLELLRRQEGACALLMLDVDYFKRYNDHYGHQAGDDCLAAVAHVLTTAVRHPQDLVGRYGGEEFVLVLADGNAEDAAVVAARIRHLLSHQAIPHAGSDISDVVTVSTGIAATSGRWRPVDLIAQADAALYRAKGSGRDRWSA